MIRTLFLAASAFVVLLTVTGCACEIDQAGMAALSTADTPPIETSDPVVKAVTEASHTVDAIKVADQLLARGLSSGEIQPIKDAADKRPADPRYASYLAAMEIALDVDSDHRSGFDTMTKAL